MSVPDTLYVLRVEGTQFWLDADARREVEAWLRSPDDLTLDVITIVGEEVTLVRGSSIVLWSSTAETRQWERQITNAINAEVPLAERE